MHFNPLMKRFYHVLSLCMYLSLLFEYKISFNTETNKQHQKKLLFINLRQIDRPMYFTFDELTGFTHQRMNLNV